MYIIIFIYMHNYSLQVDSKIFWYAAAKLDIV